MSGGISGILCFRGTLGLAGAVDLLRSIFMVDAFVPGVFITIDRDAAATNVVHFVYLNLGLPTLTVLRYYFMKQFILS